MLNGNMHDKQVPAWPRTSTPPWGEVRLRYTNKRKLCKQGGWVLTNLAGGGSTRHARCNACQVHQGESVAGEEGSQQQQEEGGVDAPALQVPRGGH